MLSSPFSATIPSSRTPRSSTPGIDGAKAMYEPNDERRRNSGCDSTPSSFDSSCTSAIEATIPSLTRWPLPSMYA
jgi:hypothetical protein